MNMTRLANACLAASLALPAVAMGQDEPVAEDGAAAVEEQSNGDVQRELRTVEEDVKRLKERVFRSKATLQLLKEIVIEGATIGSHVEVWHIDKLGPTYRVESIQYYLDGKNVFGRVGVEGELDDLREVMIFEGAVPPGTHSLKVDLKIRGNGLGVFEYLDAYSFTVTQPHTFKVDDGESSTIRMVMGQRSALFTAYANRVVIDVEETVETLRRE